MNFCRNDMLFSSSDSSNPQRALRGMGSMRKRRVAVIEVVLTCSLQQMSHWICRLLSFTSFRILLRALNHSNDALPSPYQVTLVGLYFWSSGKSDRRASPGFAGRPAFSAYVRWGAHGAPVRFPPAFAVTRTPAGTAEGCPGLRRGLFSAVPTGLGRISYPTQD